ncbi:hypothetical protein C1Y63_04275 [Corynebacterium sp. 13CS0277]|nr:hypothetical protein C1Y63_04275 [Corynebacterium sp. 13CS0277]
MNYYLLLFTPPLIAVAGVAHPLAGGVLALVGAGGFARAHQGVPIPLYAAHCLLVFFAFIVCAILAAGA